MQQEDQGRILIDAIDAFLEKNQEQPRAHLGCSQLGHACDRWLWLSFRWAVKPWFPGRVLRLFRRGQKEEVTFIQDLRAIGLDIRNVNTRQLRVEFGSHVAGSVDGIINSGMPDAPKVKYLAEFKTHNLRSFNDLEKNKLEESKPEHYIQMQCYMHGTNMPHGLYVAVCKDDDRLYIEIVAYDKTTAEKAIKRGHRITLSDTIPPPISSDPSWYQCKMCDGYDFCHKTKITKEVNCRTCAHSTALPNSTWRCEQFDADNIPVEFQRKGCDAHVLHPDLVPWDRKSNGNPNIAIYVIDNTEVANGAPSSHVYSSKELLANPAMCAKPDAFVMECRDELGATIIA